MPGLDPRHVERIAEMLDARFGLDALWLFGSVASGRAAARSDVDLAALFRRSPAPLDLLDARGEIAALLGRDVDLVDLGRASPVLAMQVVRHGRLLVERDPARRQRFVAGMPGRYEDLKLQRRPAEAALLARARRDRP